MMSSLRKYIFPGRCCGLLLAAAAALSAALAPAPCALAQTANPHPATPQAPADADSQTATATVDRLHSALIASMKAGDDAGFDARVAILDPVVRDSLDLNTISRLVLGRRWDTLNDEDRERFIDTFSRYVIADYAREFDHFDEQRFETIAEQERKPRVHIVRAALHTKSGKTHRFDYQTRQTQGRWWIVNIAVDGVSDLATKRSQYTRVIEKDGLSTLIETLESKIDDFREGRDVED